MSTKVIETPNGAAGTNNHTAHHAPRLSVSIIGFVAICGLMGMFAIWWPIHRHAQSFEERVQTDSAIRGARAVQLAVSRAVEREWASLNAVADRIDPADQDRTQTFLDAVLQAGGRVAWAGFVDQGGIVRVASRDIGTGSDVSSQRWFRKGVTEDVIGAGPAPSQTELNPAGDTQNELIYLATPIQGAFGEVVGVLTYGLRVNWLTSYVSSAADQLDLEVYLLDQNNELVGDEQDIWDAPVSKANLSALSLNMSAAQVVSGGDSGEMVYAVLPNLLVGDMPSLSMRLLVRMPSATNNANVNDLSFAIWMSMLFLFGLLLAFVGFFTQHFVRPIEKLIRIAREIADGNDVYPEEYSSSRESAELSQSLSRIQHRLDWKG